MENIIVAEGLRKEYDGFALEDVSFRVPGGAIMGLIGENGAGKTTTIKCLLNLVRRDAGTVTLLGMDDLEGEKEIKQDVGVVLDECFFHDSLRPKDLKRILGPIYPTWDDNLYADYLKKFKLPEEKLIKEFSRGMKMKLSITVALSHQPRLLILDEATSSVDTRTEERIQMAMDNLMEGRTSFVIAHRLSTIRNADCILVMDNGKLAGQGREHPSKFRGIYCFSPFRVL